MAYWVNERHVEAKSWFLEVRHYRSRGKLTISMQREVRKYGFNSQFWRTVTLSRHDLVANPQVLDLLISTLEEWRAEAKAGGHIERTAGPATAMEG